MIKITSIAWANDYSPSHSGARAVFRKGARASGIGAQRGPDRTCVRDAGALVQALCPDQSLSKVKSGIGPPWYRFRLRVDN
ncbi:protein of unknown function [Magnetospirillum sp. XM-1]|nr:protein of unknown function [Magnetospirillum sp. XM-1]